MADISRRLLLGCALLFAAWYAYELMRSPDALPSTDLAENMRIQFDVPKLSVKAPELADFKATLERPVFNKSRRPEEETQETETEDTPTQTPEAAVPVRLSAVIIRDGEKSALLEESRTRVSKRVSVGEAFSGWNLVEIREDAVVLQSGGQTTEVALRKFDAPPPPTMRRTTRRPQRTPATVRDNRTRQTGHGGDGPDDERDEMRDSDAQPDENDPSRLVNPRRSVPLPANARER